MQRAGYSGGALHQGEAVIFERRDRPEARCRHSGHLGYLPDEPAEEVDGVDAQLHQLSASDDPRICAPLVHVALAPPDPVPGAPEHRIADRPDIEYSVGLRESRMEAVIEAALQYPS